MEIITLEPAFEAEPKTDSDEEKEQNVTESAVASELRDGWVEDIGGSFLVPNAVYDALPIGSRILSAERSGVSAWTKTAKLSVRLPDGSGKNYFLKCSTGQGARALAEGEFYSATAINKVLPGFVPNPVGWGTYEKNQEQHFYYLADFHHIDLAGVPEPGTIASKLAELHSKGTSPNGKFGFHVPTVIGKMERTVTWEESWAKSFSNQLLDVIRYDNETNGPWPELAAACQQLVDVVIPRLLGVLQSEGRQITPSLIHGDLWENNVGTDMDTGNTIVFDPGSTYAHNEMEFGTWRCSWAFYFNSPVYMRSYQRLIPPSEPAEEWDDRNRLYSLHPYFTDSAGHAGSLSRKIAYNDILYLCEKYGPLETLGKYNPDEDIVLTGGNIPFVISQLE
ncbi:Fructosamine kinase-domain-containing protein [Stachybotrys elegans]|uniref:protein-ribulosamine 3-kinase n=1 Tax=Stachybotrys elegans TaxID=80388 RepID=A0A8K0SN09_9HYPO|nr:Fructosamine kinase-domain-containing protein [Stachybotrys elegans]